MRRKYGFSIKYLWVREVGYGSGNLHYHIAVFLDANKVKWWDKVTAMIQKSWAKVGEGFYGFVPKRPFYQLSKAGVIRQAVFRLSYLAKAASNGNRLPSANDYMTVA